MQNTENKEQKNNFSKIELQNFNRGRQILRFMEKKQ